MAGKMILVWVKYRDNFKSDRGYAPYLWDSGSFVPRVFYFKQKSVILLPEEKNGF
jgi:hypothetical protein